MPPVATTTTLSRRGLIRSTGAAAVGLTLAPRTLRADDRGPVPRAAPGVYRFKVGAFEAISISDGYSSMSPIRPIFAPQAGAEELKGVLVENFHPTDRAEFAYNAIVIRIGAEVVLIDTGNGPGGPTTGKLAERLVAAGVAPASVTAIIISHAHPDHIAGALDSGGAAVFPNARFFVSKAEHDFWTGNPDLGAVALPDDFKKSIVTIAQRSLTGLRSKLELVAPGDRVIDGIELVDSAGHTPGHLSVAITSGAEGLFATGDLAHNHVIMFARPEWTIAFDTDARMAVDSRKRLFDRIASERLRVHAYHTPWPGLGHIRRDGAGYQWVPEAWNWELN